MELCPSSKEQQQKRSKLSSLNIDNKMEVSRQKFKSQSLRDKQKQSSFDSVSSFYPIVGVLLSTWTNSRGKLVAKNFGSAFAIARQLVITCTHNIFNGYLNSFSSIVEFYPGVKMSKNIYQDQLPIKGSIVNIKVNYKYTFFQLGPTKEELTLILLQKPLETVSFPKLGNLDHIKVKDQRPELKIIGYPNAMTASLSQVKVARQQVSGNLHKIDDFQIQYTIPTNRGQSGSPVIAQGKNGEYFIVGIHTHAGIEQGINRGVYFSEQMFATLKKFYEQLKPEDKALNQISFYDPSPLIQEDIKNKQYHIQSQQKISSLNDDVDQECSSMQKFEPNEDIVKELSFQQYQDQEDVHSKSMQLVSKDNDLASKSLVLMSSSSSNSLMIDDFLILKNRSNSIAEEGQCDSLSTESLITIFDDFLFSGQQLRYECSDDQYYSEDSSCSSKQTYSIATN